MKHNIELVDLTHFQIWCSLVPFRQCMHACVYIFMSMYGCTICVWMHNMYVYLCMQAYMGLNKHINVIRFTVRNSKILICTPPDFPIIGIDESASALASALASVFQNFYFCLKSFWCFVMISVPLCCKYLLLYDFLFIHPKNSIGVLEKCYLNFRKHLSIAVFKK